MTENQADENNMTQELELYDPTASNVWDAVPEGHVGLLPDDHTRYIKPYLPGLKAHLPAEVATSERFIVWGWEEDDKGKAQKVPHRADNPNRKAGFYDEEASVDLETAYELYETHEHIHGVGLIFRPEYERVLGDLDDVFDAKVNKTTAEHDELVKDVLGGDEPERTFLSSSGTGMHQYPVAPDAKNTTSHPVEVYTTKRFAAVTGVCVNPERGSTGQDRSEELNRLVGEYNNHTTAKKVNGEWTFEADPVELDTENWEMPELLEDEPLCVQHMAETLAHIDPDEHGWGNLVFEKYSYLTMALSYLYDTPSETARRVASFRSPTVAETQKGNNPKKGPKPTPFGEGVPWDLEEQLGDYIHPKVQNYKNNVDTDFKLAPPGLDKINSLFNTGEPVDCGENCPIHGNGKLQNPTLIAPKVPLRRIDERETGGAKATLEDVRAQTRTFIENVFKSGQDVVIGTEPAVGKSRSSAAIIAQEKYDSVFATNTHRNMEEACEDIEREGLYDYQVLPSASRTGVDSDGNQFQYLDDTSCPTYMGEHGEAAQKRLKDLCDKYDCGPRYIHGLADDEQIDELPCQCDEEECNYIQSWQDADMTATVLIGHYNHLNMKGIRENGPVARKIVIDEFPGASFEMSWTADSDDDNRNIKDLRDDISTYLDTFVQGALPNFEGKSVYEALDSPEAEPDPLTDLYTASTMDELIYGDVYFPWEAVELFDTETAVLRGYHPTTPLVAYMLANMDAMKAVEMDGFESTGNGWFSSTVGSKSLAYDSETGNVNLMRAPNFHDRNQIIGLDATACQPMWQVAMGDDSLQVAETMTLEEKRDYYRHALKLDVIQASEWQKSLAGVGNENNQALNRGHWQVFKDYLKHAAGGSKFGVISTQAALNKLDTSGIDATKYFGNFKGENGLGDYHVGGVFGSCHPGDKEIEKWAAYKGENAKRNEAPKGDRSDWELDYQSGVGNQVYDYYLSGAVKQAIVRFSRSDDKRGLVVVYTDRIPTEIPRYKACITNYAESRREVMDAMENLGVAGLKEVASEVLWSERTVRRSLAELELAGAVKSKNGSYMVTAPISRDGRMDGTDNSLTLLNKGTVATCSASSLGNDTEDLTSFFSGAAQMPLDTVSADLDSTDSYNVPAGELNEVVESSRVDLEGWAFRQGVTVLPAWF